MRTGLTITLGLTAALQVGTALSASVDTAWVRRYDGPAGGSDHAAAMCVDAAGNVYVTGFSEGLGTSSDIATLKYGPDGALLWERRFDGEAHDADRASAIGVDAPGNVFVTGYTTGAGTMRDYITLKYSPDGALLWERSYDSPYHRRDMANSLDINAAGDVFVTGQSHGSVWPYPGYDFVTLRYRADGFWQWLHRYEGPVDWNDVAKFVRLDSAGNAYVAGYSRGSDATGTDCAVVKYTAAGNRAWVSRWAGPGRGADLVGAFHVDLAGHSYVAGTRSRSSASADFLVLKYDHDGNLLWDRIGRTVRGVWRGIGIDSAENVYVSGHNAIGDCYWGCVGFIYVTQKLDPDGNLLWSRRYQGFPTHNDSKAIGQQVDAAGNVYVTGFSEGLGTGYDYATLKYDTYGELEWITRYDGPASGHDSASALQIDPDSGFVYVTGTSDGDYLTIKYREFDHVDLDIQPGRCPNVLMLGSPLDDPNPLPIQPIPSQATPGSEATVDVAIIGKLSLDVLNVDPSECRLEGVAPVGWRYEDIATQLIGEPECECAPPRSDGVTDLLLEFPASELVSALGPIRYGEQRSLLLTGRDRSHHRLQGSDCIIVRDLGELAAGAWSSGLPGDVGLVNHPNPFNSATAIAYTLHEGSDIRLAVFDVLGRCVAELIDGYRAAGTHEVTWDGTNERGRPVATGVYYYRLVAGERVRTGKMVLIK